MAGTTKRSSMSRASSEAPKEDPRVKELEAKVAQLEASLAALAKSLEQLAQAPAPAAAASSSRDEHLRAELKKYFKTVANTKVPTHNPVLD